MPTSSCQQLAQAMAGTTKATLMVWQKQRKTLNMLSEIDIQDYEQLPVRELYKVRPRSYIKLPWMTGLDNDVLFFDHIDGMYSYCLTLKNEVVHLGAWSEVIPLQKKPD